MSQSDTVLDTPDEPRWGKQPPDDPETFILHPTIERLPHAQDRGSYILRVGILRGAGVITRQKAAELLRGIMVLDPEEM